MIFYKKGRWNLCTERVKYIQHEEEIEQYVMSEGRGWWEDFAEKWEHTEIIEFIPVEPSEEQKSRFEEVIQLNLPEGFGAELGEYVENGNFPEGFNHMLRPLQILKEQSSLEMDMSLSSMEIYNLLGEIVMQNEVHSAEMLMEVMTLISQIKGGN